MAWSTPSTQITGDLMTAAIWNQNVVYNTIALTPSGFSFVISGGGAPIQTGVVDGIVEIPFKCDLERVRLLPDQSGSIKVDMWKCTYAQYDAFSTHPADGDSICGGNEPEISSSTKFEDSTLSGYTTAFAEGDQIALNVDSCATITWCTLAAKLTRS